MVIADQEAIEVGSKMAPDIYGRRRYSLSAQGRPWAPKISEGSEGQQLLSSRKAVFACPVLYCSNLREPYLNHLVSTVPTFSTTMFSPCFLPSQTAFRPVILIRPLLHALLVGAFWGSWAI